MAPYRFSRAWKEALLRLRRRRSVILGYHGIARSARDDDLFMLQVPPDRFRAQVEMMAEAGFTFVTTEELVRRAAGGSPPPGLAALTFDDGMRSTFTNALPILRELGIPATVYVPTGWIGGESPWVGAGGDGEILSEQELRELARAGWELGSHTVTEADLSLLDYEGCRREIDPSLGKLERISGAPVRTLAYPFGHYSQIAMAAARDSGLDGAVTTGSGSWNPYELTRAMIGSADPFPVVLLKLTDRYEPLLRTPPLPLARRTSKQLRRQLHEWRRPKVAS